MQIQELRQLAADPGYVASCEEIFRQRVDAVAESVIGSGVPLILLTGPSATGKTTSARKVALAMTKKISEHDVLASKILAL